LSYAVTNRPTIEPGNDLCFTIRRISNQRFQQQQVFFLVPSRRKEVSVSCFLDPRTAATEEDELEAKRVSFLCKS